MSEIHHQCEAEILAHSDPFDHFEAASSVAFAGFLDERKVLGDVDATIGEHGTSEAGWPDFSKRLAFMGAYCCRKGLDRYELASERPVADFGAICVDDLTNAWAIVQPASETALCEPGG